MHPVEKRWCVLAEGRQSSPVPEHTHERWSRAWRRGRAWLAGMDTAPHTECGRHLMVTGKTSAGQRQWSGLANGGSRAGCGRQGHP